MKRGLDWYRRDPVAIRMAIMAARMTAAQAAVYSLVIDLIYEGGGETPAEPQHIAAHFSDMGTAKARRTIEDLIAMGKLFVVGTMLHEKRAENEAKTREKLRENRAEIGRKGGISSGKSRREARENNDLSEANASSKNEADIEREKEEEKIPPKAPPGRGGGEAPSSPPAPARKRRTSTLSTELEAEFRRVWQHYPRKVGCGAAEAAWAKARLSNSFEEITGPLGQFIRAVRGSEPSRIPHLSTWLNEKRWRDDQTHARNEPRSSTEDLDRLSRISAADDIARLMPPPVKAIP